MVRTRFSFCHTGEILVTYVPVPVGSVIVKSDCNRPGTKVNRRPNSLRDVLVRTSLNSDPSDDGSTGKPKPCGMQKMLNF